MQIHGMDELHNLNGTEKIIKLYPTYSMCHILGEYKSTRHDMMRGEIGHVDVISRFLTFL
jgi:hypothetical protein